jgi:hypothetical protein
MSTYKRRLVFAPLLVILLAIAAYYLFHQMSSSPHLAFGNPKTAAIPRVHSDSLSEKSAGTGDITHAEPPKDAIAPGAMHAAFRASQHCYFTSKLIASTQGNADCKFMEGKPEFQTQYAACLNKWVERQNATSSARASMSACPKDTDILKTYYDSTKAAAKKGDPDAQLCYLGSYFVGPDGKAAYTDKDVEEYKSSAAGYISDAFKRGDWRIVSFLAQSNFGPTSGLFPKIENIGQPQTVYKMDRLLRLGASGAYAKSLDLDLDELKQLHGRENGALPPSEIASAEEWAQQTYTQYFAGSPDLTTAPAICAFESPT